MNINLENEIFGEFEKFLLWEPQTFENWNNVKLFIAEKLSDAWILARPQDEYKFQDEEFKERVNSANGKWLEKVNEKDSYKIILSTNQSTSLQDLTKCFVHEMRHCLDYQKAVQHLPFSKYHSGNAYYNNWSEFKAVYAHTRYEYFSRHKCNATSNDIFNELAELLGKSVADSITGLMHSRNLHESMYYISRYLGASRAIRNINHQEKLNCSVFELWNLTPQYIIENFGCVFYIGNEWDDMSICGLDDTPKKYYYNELMEKMATIYK